VLKELIRKTMNRACLWFMATGQNLF